MAQIDFSALSSSFDGFSADSLDHSAKVASSPDGYSWKSTAGYTIAATSFSSNITASATAPTGGTVNAVTVIGGTPQFNITGLDVALTSLVDPTNSSLSVSKFWAAVLAGDTTVVMPGAAGVTVRVMGDVGVVRTGQSITTGNDKFLGANNSGMNYLVGDSILVETNAKLTAGDDVFDGVAGTLIGDVGLGGSPNAGTILGGDDTFKAVGNPLFPMMSFDAIVGDVEQNIGKVVGGADKVDLTDVANAGTIVGDVFAHVQSSVVGGNDTISIKRTGMFSSPTNFAIISGDVLQTGAGAIVTGGDDKITVKDAVGGALVGDVMQADGNVDAGDDVIFFGSSAPFFSGPPAAAPAMPTVSQLIGDVFDVGASDTLKGGNDKISLVNAIASMVSGDLQTGKGVAHQGGDDTIALTWTQANLSTSPFNAQGDFLAVTSGNASGGNDTITLSYTSNVADHNASINGDGSAFTGAGNLVGGNDVITLNSNRSAGTTMLAGDVLNVNTTGTFTGGNDTIIGSNGADQIFGEGATVMAANIVGGNDILNGRGGNDRIDGGLGNDTAVYSSLAQSVYVDLGGIAGTAANPADWVEAVGQGADQLIGIENIIGSSLDDTIIGDGLANRLSGGAGNDKLDGGAGNDTLTGGAGTDKLTGGTGDDTYVLENGSDSVIDTGGTDTITSTISRSLAYYAAIERLTLTGAAAVNGTGNVLANIITGNAANNVLNGGAGADTLVGGAGNDIYVLADGNDAVTDTSGTADTITSTISRSLAGYATIEKLSLLGTANINGVGNGLANTITGNAGNNILDGGAGADRLAGGAGNDTYVLVNGTDVVVDSGGAADMITSTISRSLATYAAIEKLSLLGTANINGTGNGLANTVTGNAGNNVLDGGAGNDRLVGGTGNDTYVLANGGDVVVDTGGTADMITSTISRSLANYATIEKLSLLGTANINGTGNGLANTIVGNAGNNILNGGLGQDVLTGGAGNDSFRFDTALSAANVDRITDFSAPQDTIVLENAIFKGLTAGTLAATAFVKNTTGLAADANDRIVYETDTGKLFYDSNGNAAGGSVHFATVNPNLALTNLDFHIV